MIEVSVIVPVYKVEKYLRRCVDSLLDQDYSDYEIVLVDDGSPDNCPQICDDYEKREDKVTVIHKENGGLSDARNVGVKCAKGKYVVFVDSDDYVNKNHISSLYSLIEKYHADIVCSPPIIEYEISGNPDSVIADLLIEKERFKSFVISTEEAQAMILRGKPVGTSAWSKIIKREYCIKHPFPKGKVMEELATTYYIIGEGIRVAVTGVPSYHYVQRKGSILHSRFTLAEIQEYMKLAENYVVGASSENVKRSAASRIFLLARRLGCAVPLGQENDAYIILNSFCKKYFPICFFDKNTSLREKVKFFLMSVSPITFKFFIKQIQYREERHFGEH